MAEYLKRLKELRKEKGLSQKELAAYLGISNAAYSLYERGDREPNISTLMKIANYYGVTVDELLGTDNTASTIAAHFDGTEFTEDELEEIRQFAEFVKNKRK